MKLVVTSDAEAFEVQVSGKWRMDRKTAWAVIKSVIATLVTTGGVLIAPHLHELAALLGQ